MSKHLGIQGMLILWIIFFLGSVLRALLIDHDEVRIKSQPRKKFPVQLSMQNIHHCNQWNTSFLLICYNGLANAYFWRFYSSKTYIHAIWIDFFNKLLRKTQISLGIRPVWSESFLCAQWVAKGSMLLQADSEDSDQTRRMRRLISVFAGRTVKDS